MFPVRPFLAMLGVFLLTFFVNIDVSNCVSYKDFVKSVMPTICPYTDLCSMSAKKQIPHEKKSPCCIQCSCESDCVDYGSCCPDHPTVLNSATPVTPTVSCSAPISYKHDDFQIQPLYQGFHFYRIVKTCSEGHGNMGAIQNCLYPDRLHFRDNVIVSDERGRTFSNHHCARCNNVTSYKEWDSKLICDQYSDQLTNVSDVQTLNHHKCIITSSPPEGVSTASSRCFETMFSKCNVTGLWKSFNPYIEKACLFSSFTYFAEKIIGPTSYRNPFCFLCNDEDTRMTHKCTALDDSSLRDTSKVNTFASLLNLNDQSQPDVNNRQECDVAEIMDPYFGKCRRLHCPIAMIPHNGKCIQVFKATNSLSVYIQIQVTFADETTKQWFQQVCFNCESHSTDLETVALAITADIDISSCSKCFGYFLMKDAENNAIFVLGFNGNNECTLASLINAFEELRTNRTYNKIRISKTKLSFSTQLTYGVDVVNFGTSYLSGYNRRIMVFAQNQECHFKTYLKPMFYCSHLDLSPDEYETVKSMNNPKVDLNDFLLVNHKNTLGNATDRLYRICAEKYLNTKRNGAKPRVLDISGLIALIAFGVVTNLLY